MCKGAAIAAGGVQRCRALPATESTEKNTEKKGPKGEKGFLKKQQNLQGKEVVDKNSGTAPLAPVSVLLATYLAAASFCWRFLSSPQTNAAVFRCGRVLVGLNLSGAQNPRAPHGSAISKK